MLDINKHVPSDAPTNGNCVTRCIGKVMLTLIGYKIEGRFANEPKMMLIGSPHTSNWDLFLAIGITLSLGVRINFMMKQEAFFFPFKSLFIALGGIPIDRSSPQQVVKGIVDAFHSSDKYWVAILPEGTRKPVTKWKSGFIRIANTANVPIFIIGVDSRTKTVHLDRLALAKETAEDLKDYSRERFYGIVPENN
jgi:1-acyl-sn-glycerol-3-phosphate acyltransferase